jgi:phospholipid-binding lipoprotein MlaA
MTAVPSDPRPQPRPQAGFFLAVPFAATLLLALAGCATPPPASDPDALADYRESNDPLEPTNRVLYRVNDGLDTVILRPVAVAYRDVVPMVVRDHTHDFLVNLSNPVTLASDIMQGKPRRAGDTLMRLLINSTVGLGGIFDVASDWGYQQHDTDFGITLAIWGLPQGPYLFLPLFGPSSPRDATGIVADIALDPLTWLGQGSTVTALGYARYGVNAVDTRSRYIDGIDQVKRTALDPYATFRSLYRQQRASQIRQTEEDNRATVPAWYPQPNPSAPPAPTPHPGVAAGNAPELK